MTTKQKTSKPAAKRATTKAKKSGHVAAEPIAQAIETLPAALETASAPAPVATATPAETVAPSAPSVTIETSTEKPALTIGMLQKRLYERGFYFGHWDGHYGPLTKEAVGHFQFRNGLHPDGEATPETLAALGF